VNALVFLLLIAIFLTHEATVPCDVKYAALARTPGRRQHSPTKICVILWLPPIWILRKPLRHGFEEGATMSSAKQKSAARRNVKKAVAAAKSKKTISHLSKATRTALGKQGAKVAKERRAHG
jgi:hypothetical protein